VVLKPDFNISTKKAFEFWDQSSQKKLKKGNKTLIESINEQNIHKIAQNLFNSFEEASFFEKISEIKQQFLKLGALGTGMSGSGSAIFAIFNDKAIAESCLFNFKKNYENLYLCEPTKTGFEFE
jgi:4-diphosphocytidyl-2-C-methyl-D-erythritol kinase